MSSKDLKVLYIAAEATPFIKIGGLGDVAGSLPIAIRREFPPGSPNGVDIRLVIPYYPHLDNFSCTPKHIVDLKIQHQDKSLKASVFLCENKQLPVYLIKGDPINFGKQVYSSEPYKDGLKFTFFSLATLALTKKLNWRPDIIHGNDWHTSAAIYALFLRRKHDVFFRNTKSLLTIHNLPYLGIGAESALREFGLPPAVSSPLPNWAQSTPLPLGLLSADQINTVSPGYAKEILTKEYGSGLEKFLQSRAKSITGILNGIDTNFWNPKTDPNIYVNYTKETLRSRSLNKAKFQESLNLKIDKNIPLIGMVTRMDYQKGVDLLPSTLRSISNRPWQAIILGSGDPKIEEDAQILENEFPSRIRAIIQYHAILARKIYAGSDMLLIPSRYEPCGLTQMIAMRYGNVPIARATGGLRDTIIDYSLGKRSTGFLFDEPSTEEFTKAIRRALDVYSDKRKWRGLQIRGMKLDHSWENSAAKYVSLYTKLTRKPMP